MTTKLACVVVISTALAGSAAVAQTNAAGGQDAKSITLPVHKVHRRQRSGVSKYVVTMCFVLGSLA